MEHGFGLDPGPRRCGAADTEPRIPDMATTFTLKPLVSAFQVGGRVLPDTLKKEKSTNILPGQEERFFWHWEIWLQREKLHETSLCHFTGTLRGIWSPAWCWEIKRGQAFYRPESGDGGLLSASDTKALFLVFKNKLLSLR